MSLRDELIQVAAVAVAVVEDLDYGAADSCQPHPEGGFSQDRVFTDVMEERMRQDEKWGPRHLDPDTWLAILAEEVGEVAAARAVRAPMIANVSLRNTLYYLQEAEYAARAYLEEIGAA